MDSDVKTVRKFKRWKKTDWQLFSMASYGAVFLIVFAYVPMFGIILAFKDGDFELNILNAITNASWTGFASFKEFFSDDKFISILTNTVVLNLLMVLINFPAPIIFALLINEVKHGKFKRVVQTIANFPYFLSWIVFGGIILSMINLNTGVFVDFINLIIGKRINFASAQYFWGTIILTSLIKGLGWASIIYLAAIASIDPELYEAARIDGANRWHGCIYITLPGIAPTITLFFLLTLSGILGNNFEQFYVFQNAINLSKSEVITTYVYKTGIAQRRYSYVTAVGLFNSVVAVILLAGSNFVSKKLTGRGVF